MKRSAWSVRNQNQGFSLIELIVTVLVSSMVFMMATLLLTSGLRMFEKVDTETVIQEESQAAQFYLTELFQEATDYNVLTDDELEGSGMKMAIEVQKAVRDGDAVSVEWYVLAQVGDELRIGKVTAEDTAGRIEEMKNLPKSKTFLAKCVSSVSVTPNSYTGVVGSNKPGETPVIGTNFLLIDYNFVYMGKSYITSSIIKPRNVQIN